ncbi:MAG TPA: hypothetical protein VNC78_05010 [Actinomycetota bacterium]|nr:hypothetical protein [Actinomycetota bacterium]
MTRKPQRAGALIVLATVIALVSGVLTAAAQGPAPSIQLLNPSSHSTIVSDKLDADATYHLVAWTAGAPASALVEFEIQQGTSPTITIGTATRVGADTFSLAWDIPPTVTDGSYRVRAILYSGSPLQEVGRDEQVVEINHQSGAAPTALDAAETVEIVYPAIGGQVGVYAPPPGPAALVADVALSAGATRVRLLYTTSPTGTEPAWTVCGSETAAQAADGVRCTFAATDGAMSITALAAVANETPLPPPAAFNESLNESGDAHRVEPYLQVPQSVTIQPSIVRVDPAVSGAFPCAPISAEPAFLATVIDQRGRRIAAVNVDVHAQGPTDQLAFDTSTQSHPNQPPDANHTPPEPAYSCQSGTFSGQQGDHNVAGDADTKHIESVTGTNDAGQFSFRLHTDAGGATRITAWADIDADDLLCSAEPAGSASIGWGQDAPPPTALTPDTFACAGSTPTPTAIGSITPTPTVTSSASPTASATPTRTVTPTATTTATPTATQTQPSSAPREVTLELSTNKTTFNKTFTLSGRIQAASNAAPSCSQLTEVVIFRDVAGGNADFEEFARTTTDQAGTFTLTRNADRSAGYVAQVDANALCQNATSSTETLLVKKKVSLSGRPAAGGIAWRISVRPCAGHERDRVRLQKRIGGRWVTQARPRTNTSCVAKVTRTGDVGGTWRAVAPKTDADHLGGRSARKQVS